MKEVFSIVLVIIGALIGAGFASGQEIYSFFYSYGNIGIIGVIVTCFLISFIIYKSLRIIHEYQINNYNEFLDIFIKNNKITKFINSILNILLLISFYIMIAGFGAYFEQEIGIKSIIGSGILSILTGITFFSNIKGVLKVSEYIVPILIIFIIIIGANNLILIEPEIHIKTLKRGWLLSGIIYCSYNMLLLIPVLISIKNQIKDSRNIKYIAILCGILMVIMSVYIYMLLTKINIDISTLEMPSVYVVSNFFPQYKLIYAFIILASIFTTAISIGIGFLQNMSKNKKSYTQFVLFMCITSLLISKIGFSKLVKFVYQFFGIVGIIQIILITATRTVPKNANTAIRTVPFSAKKLLQKKRDMI